MDLMPQRLTGLIATNRQWRNRHGPQRAICRGLARLGCQVEIVAPAGRGRLFDRQVEVAFMWNGISEHRRRIAEQLRAAGTTTFIMERGFFDRYRYTQIDDQGFNHTASWALTLNRPAPPEGRSRLRRSFGHTEPMRPRAGGYILVLGQVAWDNQLRDSEIQEPTDLVQAVEHATPSGAELRVRTHPQDGGSRDGSNRARLLDGTLKDAVAGARFAITINSNAGNEALGWGCPVLCLGPALYAMTGVAKQTKLAALAAAIEMMLDGWAPPADAVQNYLRWLR